MKKMVKKVLGAVYPDSLTEALSQNMRSAWRILAWHFHRGFGRADRKIINRYFRETGSRKLHIGCGGNALDGWLNSDFFPESENIIHLDATQPFPFADNEFDFVFSEHMIEHIPYPQGLFMLSECRRVLTGKGKIRISTPDLSFLIGIYGNGKSELQENYIKWTVDKFIQTPRECSDTFVINNFVRAWGHSFIYDEKTLRAAMEKAEFSAIRRCELNESEEEVFRNLENERRMPPGFLRLETMTLEATK